MTYRKAELKAFVALGVEDKLADDELSLLGSVLEFSGKTVGSVMVSYASGRRTDLTDPVRRRLQAGGRSHRGQGPAGGGMLRQVDVN